MKCWPRHVQSSFVNPVENLQPKGQRLFAQSPNMISKTQLFWNKILKMFVLTRKMQFIQVYQNFFAMKLKFCLLKIWWRWKSNRIIFSKYMFFHKLFSGPAKYFLTTCRKLWQTHLVFFTETILRSFFYGEKSFCSKSENENNIVFFWKFSCLQKIVWTRTMAFWRPCRSFFRQSPTTLLEVRKGVKRYEFSISVSFLQNISLEA